MARKLRADEAEIFSETAAGAVIGPDAEAVRRELMKQEEKGLKSKLPRAESSEGILGETPGR